MDALKPEFKHPKEDTVISRKIILRPRTERVCNNCGRVIKGPQARLYGRASASDQPWVLFCHVDYNVCHIDRY